ncbi:YihY/virulence factor BrkB family protein [Pseudoroseomonas globiformis]|uniref:YihY/virulence factor BrkB family protein n=1 Tax=Teichococcus globiformis TaxID=2307229 RepID=A0ABV7G0J4_9PROT
MAATPDSQGHDAASPTQIPRAGWWGILRRAAKQVSENRILTEAAGITFYALLALFPAITAMVSLYGLVAEPATITGHLQGLSQVLPAGGMQIVEEQARRVASKADGTLGIGAAVGLGTALWSANAATKAFFDALNIVYEEKEKRGFLLRTAVSLAFTIAGIVFVLLAISAIVVVPLILNFVGLGNAVEWLLALGRWPILLIGITALLACLYRYGPSRERARWRWVSWGGAFASLGWLLFSAAFSWYAANFGSYDETYGSLGAVVGFMTWIWLSSTVVLVGAEINAEMERQTTVDSTTGEARPMGQRGAAMADKTA